MEKSRISEAIEFNILGDERGLLIALENNKDIPFDFKRVFYIYDTKKNVFRGQHAHYKTKQCLVAVNGVCKVSLDDGKNKKTFVLDKPNIGLVQDALVWGTMHDFSNDCVLMVLADRLYEENDYIREYDIFLRVINSVG